MRINERGNTGERRRMAGACAPHTASPRYLLARDSGRSTDWRDQTRRLPELANSVASWRAHTHLPLRGQYRHWSQMYVATAPVSRLFRREKSRRTPETVPQPALACCLQARYDIDILPCHPCPRTVDVADRHLVAAWKSSTVSARWPIMQIRHLYQITFKK